MLEIFGAILGFIYLYLEYRASIHLWIVGAIMPIVYAIVYFQADLYAQSCLQLYYVVAAIYGWGIWRRKARTGEHEDVDTAPIKSISFWTFRLYLFVGMILTIPIMLLLLPFADDSVSVTDALIAGLSIVAMWMLSKKIAEQWLMWLIVDFICVIYYYHLSVTTDTSLYATAILYCVYCVLAVFGYFKWKSLIEEDDE